MPIGFPPTASGVELRILRQLFTPAEAELALALSVIPEPSATIHKRCPPDATLAGIARRLDAMADKGVILKLAGHGTPLYGKLIYAVGIYERQVQRLTPELERDSRQYLEEAFGQAFHRRKTTQMRVVPVNRTIPVESSVANYDDIRACIAASPGPFAKMTCICRYGRSLLGGKCLQTTRRESCLMLGDAAEWAVKSGSGTAVSKAEMLELLDAADRDGLVLQSENTQAPLFICCCCSCCCGVLTSAKTLPQPADFFSANFYAAVDREACSACGTCASRCPMDAIAVDGEGKPTIDCTRCIGCGLCRTACPSEALHLIPKERQRTPPSDTRALYLKLLHDRYGALGMAKLGARAALKLKI
jgi:Na+-translocating ferredoxin:NAD+ oxidoreductase subunit B